MDALFVPLAQAAGASIDQIKLISCLLIAFPLGSVFVRIPSSKPHFKHLFNIAIAVFFFLPVLQIPHAFAQLLGSVGAAYAIARFHTGASMPWVVFVVTMGHLTVNHTIRYLQAQSYETMDITGPQMVLTMKLTTFAWNVYDGRRPLQDLDKWQTAKRIPTFPSLLEFLGYAFYFPGVLVGPYLEFVDYMELITEKLYEGHVKENAKRNLPSGRKRVAYRKMLEGLVYLAIFVLLGAKYNFATILTPWFAEQSLWYRLICAQPYGTLERCKYYAVWTLTEGASILTGLGFTGYTPSGASTWTGAANVIPLAIEVPSNFKTLLDAWNMKTNVWLRECVYKRVTPKGKKPGFASSMITFATSAFWHGVAGGYYLTFILGGFITTAGRLARANVRPLVMPAPGEPPSLAKRAYDLAGTLAAVMMVNYVAVPFMLLTVKDSLVAWYRLAFHGHVLVFSMLGFFYLGGARLLGAKGKGKTSSGTTTPVGEKTFVMPPSLDSVMPPRK
ncbi:endoplasmic reticulum protein [Armillaria luteobubalina]|uniref:Endoplasmic reticulum protein n=1 Tax=Armillaria luteobubalina TaxID=153913 RepID=A0AA39Q8M6_9AGAR|nr:endoplasmic reticulum protein [Armillaria luteobubalina]